MSARIACKHSVAILGQVTHAANNHVVQIVRDDGSTMNKVKRDVTEPAHKRTRRFKEPPKPSSGDAPPPIVVPPPPVESSVPLFLQRVAKRANPVTHAALQHRKRARLADEQCLRQRVNAIGALCTASPSLEGSATHRLQALAERVKAKAAQT